jgi:class 3 adenylate cyclase/tetratricopeptide (TPR) repeat protein
VTVVFCDLVGSTTVGEALDPEALRGIVGRYFDAMQAAIERHGGTVEKFIGDAVMAVFGVPALHEDDALRAVRAAHDMRAELDRLNDDLTREHGLTLACRIGVNTGEVMAGSGDQKLVTGDPVNLAARLEQAAAPGEILLGEATAALVRDAVTVVPTETLVLKGKADPVVAYRLLELDPAAAGFARHLDAPIVGRDRELALLASAFERTVTDRACQLFTVLGVGGVGKSRLMAAFVDGLGVPVTVLRGRCLPYGDGITFWPLAEALIEVAGLREADPPEDARAKLADLAGGGELGARIADRVGQAIGIPGSETAAEETLWAVRLLLERLAAEAPVVFVIDDLQWAEPKLLELIEFVADVSRDAPILLACMARPELLETRSDWGGGKLNATSILLEPLAPEECRTLVANLLADDAVDDRVRDRIASAAEGHPLYAEEITALLVDEGRLVLKDGRWVASGDLVDVPVPPTISALLGARLDRLPPDERSVIGIASVMGQVFYTDALAELAAGGGPITPAIAGLVRRQFVRPERSDLSATDAMAFRHLLIRDAAYAAVPKAERADLHERFVGWLVHRGGAAAEQDEILGYHLEQAHRYRAELGAQEEVLRDLADRAARHLARAGERARDRFDDPAASNLLERAAALMERDDPARVELLMHLGRSTREVGRLAEGVAILEEAERTAERVGDEVLLAKARIVRAEWGHDLASGQIWGVGLGKIAEELIPVFRAHGDDAGLGIAWGALGGSYWNRSLAERSADAWGRAAEFYRRAGDRRQELHTLEWLAACPILGPRPVSAAFEEVDAILERVRGSVAVETAILDSRAWLLVMTGRLDEARTMMEERRRTLHELGSREFLAFESQSLGWLEYLAGRLDVAERIFGEALLALREMRSQTATVVAAFHAQVLYRMDRLAEAADDAAFTLEREHAGLSGEVMAKGVLARIAAREGRVEEALVLQRDAVEAIDRSDFTNDRADARMDLSEVLELSGRRADARAAAAEALALYDEKGNTFQAAMARDRIERLSD